MLEFLKDRSLILERIESRSNDRALKEKELRSKGSHGHSKSQAGNKGAANLKTSSLTSSLTTGKCFLCDGSHLLFVCEKFLALSVADRIKEVRRLKLCINCLRNDHYVKACKKDSCREWEAQYTMSSTTG